MLNMPRFPSSSSSCSSAAAAAAMTKEPELSASRHDWLDRGGRAVIAKRLTIRPPLSTDRCRGVWEFWQILS